MRTSKVNALKFIDRATELENQIKKLKTFLESQITNCNDEKVKGVFLTSKGTLVSMEKKLKTARLPVLE